MSNKRRRQSAITYSYQKPRAAISRPGENKESAAPATSGTSSAASKGRIAAHERLHEERDELSLSDELTVRRPEKQPEPAPSEHPPDQIATDDDEIASSPPIQHSQRTTFQPSRAPATHITSTSYRKTSIRTRRKRLFEELGEGEEEERAEKEADAQPTSDDVEEHAAEELSAATVKEGPQRLMQSTLHHFPSSSSGIVVAPPHARRKASSKDTTVPAAPEASNNINKDVQFAVHAEERDKVDQSQAKGDPHAMESENNEDDERLADPHSNLDITVIRRSNASPVSQLRPGQAAHDKEDEESPENEQQVPPASVEKMDSLNKTTTPEQQLTLQPKSRIPRKPLQIPNEYIMAEGPHWYRIETKGSKQWRIQMKWMTEQKMIDFWEEHKRFTFAVWSEEYDRYV